MHSCTKQSGVVCKPGAETDPSFPGTHRQASSITKRLTHHICSFLFHYSCESHTLFLASGVLTLGLRHPPPCLLIWLLFSNPDSMQHQQHLGQRVSEGCSRMLQNITLCAAPGIHFPWDRKKGRPNKATFEKEGPDWAIATGSFAGQCPPSPLWSEMKWGQGEKGERFHLLTKCNSHPEY